MHMHSVECLAFCQCCVTYRPLKMLTINIIYSKTITPSIILAPLCRFSFEGFHVLLIIHIYHANGHNAAYRIIPSLL